jgi:hypothetical protein
VIALLFFAARAAAQPDAGAPDAGHDAGIADAAIADAADASHDAAADPRADELPPELRPDIAIAIDPASGLVTGDVVHLTMTVTGHEGDRITVPEQSFEPFDVLETHSTESPPENGRARHVFTLDLLALEPGDHTIGPIELRVLTRDNTVGAAFSDTVSVSIGSVLGNEPDAQPKPPTTPVQVFEKDYTLAWVLGVIGALLLLAVVMFFVARWWLKRERPAPPPPPPRPPWEIAMEKLGALEASLPDHISRGAIVNWADALSDVVREYLGARYDFDGLESTTDEVLARLDAKKPKELSRRDLRALLGDLDLVKFAKASPNEEQCREALGAAMRLVTDTKSQKSFAEPPKRDAPAAETPAGGPP